MVLIGRWVDPAEGHLDFSHWTAIFATLSRVAYTKVNLTNQPELNPSPFNLDFGVPCLIIEKSMIQLSSHSSFSFWYLSHYKDKIFWALNPLLFGGLTFFQLCESHHCSEDEGQAEQADRQTDGHFGRHGHGTIATVGWTGGAKLPLLTNIVTTNWRKGG